MKSILNKLRSRAGASMILAMVFMLFCSFIGGTVLASATANAQRVAQLAEQQDFLLERSAALLVSDQIQLDNGKRLRLNVMDSTKTISEMVLHENGSFVPNGNKQTQRVITFQVTTNASLTSMHRLILESSVWRYLRENGVDPSKDIVELQDFPGSVSTLSDFLFQYTMPSAESDDYTIEGTLNVTAKVQGGSLDSIPAYTANFSCGRADHLFDFFLDFGEDSQVKMSVNGYSGTSNPITVVEKPVVSATSTTGYSQTTTVTTQTTISWEDPLIEKGGAPE